MAQPTPYAITTDFSEEEASGVSGRSTVRTPALDVEFANLATTFAQVLANLATLQRDDTKLQDGSVELHTLAAEVLVLLGSAGFTIANPVGWLTATAYPARQMVTQGTGTYVSAVAHTSGTFATDLAAGKWVTLYDSSAYNASGVSFSPTGTIAATNVQAALAEAASEAVQKASNLSDVTASTARANLSVFSKAEAQSLSSILAVAGGSVDAITAVFNPALTAWANGQLLIVECAGANATTTSTFNPDALGAKTIARPDGSTLSIGDIPGADFRALFVYDASLDKVLLLNPAYQGGLWQRVHASSATYSTVSTLIPNDDTIPQSTEGGEILSAAITPKNATHTIRVRISVQVSANSSARATVALFKDSEANALAAQGATLGSASMQVIQLEYEEPAASLSARTYKVRVGPSTGNCYVNGNSTSRQYGGVSRATLTVDEVR